MTEKRYSVFISSTYEDLREERQAVQDAILSAGDFPVQMETFPAADEDQFEFIKSLIDTCDYYVLIVAGRYGTAGPTGMSFTEMEYNYAKSKNIPVLVMLHGDPGGIAVSKAENSEKGKERLEAFVREISSGRLRKTWTNSGELKHAVRDALDNAKATRPGVGWVRGDTTASAPLLRELNEVRKENEKYRNTIGHLEVELSMPPIPAASEDIEIDLLPESDSANYVASPRATYARVKSTWLEAFPFFHSALQWTTSDWNGEFSYFVDNDDSRRKIGEAISAELAGFETKGLYAISRNSFDRLMSYYIEVGLVLEDGDEPFSEAGRRLARRHRIAGGGAASFNLVEGEVKRIYPENKRNIDDEIPF